MLVHPVFCISGVELYEPLAKRLAARFPVFGLFSQAEARYWSGADATGSSAVRDLAADYLAAIRRERPSGPYVLAGFSFGGVVAYEIAQQLRAIGADVPLLVVLDSDPPTVADSSASPGWPLPTLPVRSGARALLDLGRRLGDLALSAGGAGGGFLTDRNDSRRPRYLAAMREYRADPYPGRVLLVESMEDRLYDPGHGWRRFGSTPRGLPSRGHPR